MTQYDLIVIGGGAGGTGAALTAARLGLRTLWVEKERTLGGTGVHSLVSTWQPAVSRGALARELAETLVSRGQAHYIGPDLNTPTGRPLYRHVEGASYDDTLRRWGDRERRLISPHPAYTPEAMSALLAELAASLPTLEVWTETVFLQAHTEPGRDGLRRMTGLTVERGGKPERVEGGAFIDATGDVLVARDAGCETACGRESQDVYGESLAPPEHEFRLNGWTLCFEVRLGPDRVALPDEGWGHDGTWAHISQLPDGAYNINMVYQLSGEAGWRMGPEQAREVLLTNVARRWPGVRAAYGLQEYGISRLAARVGVREGPRLVGRYVLTEHDVRRGDWGRHHPDCIAWTDHAMDRHSPDGGCIEDNNGPLGIPLRCAQTREFDNLLVACRGASFSSLAASAVRLQRTVMELGEAAARLVAGAEQDRCE
ncbi:FAD-dependent oxidoreductase [bacterium]|nr:FAD-dependent oxidoreductase [bacterium]